MVLCLLGAMVVGGCAPDSGVYGIMLSFERALAGVSLHSVDVDGEPVAYLEREADGPVVVLLHGFAANKDNWLRFIKHLPRSYRVLAIDLPAHGDNGYDAALTYDAALMSRRLTRALEELDVAEAHVVGNSLGGWVGILYASAHPQRVNSLTLIDSAGVVPPIASELQLALLEGENPLLVRTEDDFERLMDFVFYHEPFIPWLWRNALAQDYIQRIAVNEKIWNDISADLEPVDPLLGGLPMPVLLVWGDRDRVLHVSSVDVFREHLTDVRSIIMSDCGHAPMVERPAEAASYVEQFLAGELASGTHVTAPAPAKLDVQSRKSRDKRSR